MSKRNFLFSVLAFSALRGANSSPIRDVDVLKPVQDFPSLSDIGAKTTDNNCSKIINDALKMYGGLVGGRGCYFVDNLVLPSGCIFIMNGRQATIFKQISGANGPIISADGDAASFLSVGGFTLDGNKSSQISNNHGMVLNNSGSGLRHKSLSQSYGLQDPRNLIFDIFIFNTKGSGFCQYGKGASSFRDIWVYGADGHGVEVMGFDNDWHSIDVGASGLSGFYMGAGAANNRLNNIKAWYCGRLNSIEFGQGVYMDHSFRNQINNVEVQNCNGSQSIYLKSANYNQLLNFNIEGPTFGSPAPMYDGLVLEDSSFGIFSGIISDRFPETSRTLRNGVIVRRRGAGCKGLSLNILVNNFLENSIFFDGIRLSDEGRLFVNGDDVTLSSRDARSTK